MNAEGLRSHLESAVCCTCTGDSEIEVRLDCLYSDLQEAIDLYVPISTFKQRKGNYQWARPEYHALIREKDRLYRHYR